MIKHINVNKLTISSVLLFPFLPFISLLLFAIAIAAQSRISKFTFYLLFILLSIYLSLINVTKVPESDLINYYEYFFLNCISTEVEIRNQNHQRLLLHHLLFASFLKYSLDFIFDIILRQLIKEK